MSFPAQVTYGTFPSGGSASDPFRISRADLVALGIAAIASGSAHVFTVQGLMGVSKDPPASASVLWATVTRPSGSAMILPATAGPLLLTASADLAPFDWVRIVCQSAQLAVTSVCVICKPRT